MTKEDDIKPGVWRDAPLGSFSTNGVVDTTAPMSERQELQPTRPTVSKGLVEVYHAFQESLFGRAANITHLYYPSCDLDITPVSAFPNARVTFADINSDATSMLQEAGHDARNVDATAWVPEEEMDVVVLLNPTISPRVPARAARQGGYILANNYHSTANALKEDSEFSFVGIIRRDPITGTPTVDTEELDACWQEVVSDAEFEAAPFSFSPVRFDDARKLVRRVFGTTENILGHFRELVDRQRAEALAEGRDPDLRFLEYHDDGMTHYLPTELPRRKGAVDDIFIFQRKEKEDTRPEWMRSTEKGRGNVVVDGEVYTFTIIDRELEPRLPGFVGFPGGEHLFASEEVPIAYRSHILAHEVREFTQLQDQEGRCLTALKRELEGVSGDMRGDYIAYRRKFFTNLVVYYQNSADAGFRREIQASLDYLQAL